MNLLLAIFYSSYQEKVDLSHDKFRERRNNFLMHLFRKYDTNNEKKIGKEGVFHITKEIHSLANGLDQKSEKIDMTPLQFE